MTNYERWRLLMKDVPSPQSYVDWGFLGLIASALQRRVWLSDMDFHPVFPSMFIVLTGPPATGKGNVLKPVKDMLSHHKQSLKYNDKKSDEQLMKEMVDKTGKSVEEIAVIAAEDADAMGSVLAAQRALDDNKTVIYGASKQQLKERTLFAIAPDALTFQDLCRHLAKSVYMHTWEGTDPTGAAKKNVYFYKSLTFVLEELSSLFNKDAELIVNYFLTAYDCRDYNYSTKHNGQDIITKPCVNLVAGTTPDYMKRIFSSNLMNEGIGSRTFFIYEKAPRRRVFMMRQRVEGGMAREQLLQHIECLSKVYGEVSFTDEAYDYCCQLWETDAGYQELMINRSPKLDKYYGRKNLHIMKVAMALHFTESLDNLISLSTVKRAVKMLAHAERNMHLALASMERNPIYNIQQDILAYMQNIPVISWADVLREFYYGGNQFQLQEAWKVLAAQGYIEPVPLKKGEVAIYYKLKKDLGGELTSES